jgi:hypothetical protein
MKRKLLLSIHIVFFAISFLSIVGCNNKKVDYELQDICRKSSQEYFNNQIISNSLGNTNWEYENHYNRKLNKCIMLSTGLYNNGDMIKKLINVNENKEYGFYVSIGNKGNGHESGEFLGKFGLAPL